MIVAYQVQGWVHTGTRVARSLISLHFLVDIQSKRLYVLAPGSSVNLCDKSKSGVGGGEDLVTAKS